MENISKHITLKEATHSNKAIALGIENIPNEKHLVNMKLVAEKCFEPLREWYQKPIKINSFFRNPTTNRAIGGSATSDHMNGCAIDLTGGSIEENKKLFEWAKTHLQFDQLIFENGGVWLHCSYRANGNRNEVKHLTQK
jgi:zinc D-Ala-D-Ala carboxypeptidase